MQVLNIMAAIYRILLSVSTEIALNSLKKILLALTHKEPREVVASMLQCSPKCNSRYGAQQPLAPRPS